MREKITAEKLLDDIFSIMQRLYNEMRSNKEKHDSHLKVFEIFAELGRTLVSADRASFWRWDKREHKLLTTAATGTQQIIIDDTTGLVGQALAENRAVITNDPYNHPNFNSAVDKKTGYVTKSILVMPVSNCRGETIGAFQVINKLDGEGFDEVEDTKRLSVAAFICGMALESDMFLADSQRDNLTELKNRFAFHSDYESKYRDKKIPMSIAICDIDFFKKVNDTYGHNAGDAVLKHVAQMLEGKTRSSDSVYRWGGEEFIIVLEGAPLAGAFIAADRVRQAIMNSVCKFEDKEIRVTMSFGCAEIDNKLSAEENIKIADERLYHAKANGRNQVCIGTRD
ncbi:MAG: sensor domain-containing diguanylate cyclase [Selenomonadaceae bacterium]|nr:sensor domain-containing diguanylate cyclase [Selenomonadaceae bacterium]